MIFQLLSAPGSPPVWSQAVPLHPCTQQSFHPVLMGRADILVRLVLAWPSPGLLLLSFPQCCLQPWSILPGSIHPVLSSGLYQPWKASAWHRAPAWSSSWAWMLATQMHTGLVLPRAQHQVDAHYAGPAPNWADAHQTAPAWMWMLALGRCSQCSGLDRLSEHQGAGLAPAGLTLVPSLCWCCLVTVVASCLQTP